MNAIKDPTNPGVLATPGGPHWGLSTLVEVAQWRATQQGAETAYTFLLDGEAETASLSYADLDQRARRIAAELQRHGPVGQRVLVVLEPGLDYVAALYGCFYAGAIAVPVYPPDPFRLARTLPRLQAIFSNAECGLLISSKELLGGERSALRRTCPRGAIAIEEIQRAGDWRPPASRGEDIALLQYTSGTTGVPRGVAISHDNLQYNMRAMEQLLDVPDAVVMHWLPPYHDLGLIGGVFLPLFAGRRVVLMSPLDFMRSPARWLQAISRFRATTSASPNFGYEVCLRKITEEQCEELDLSCWQIAASGAEQVRGETLDRFCEKFAPYGFRREAFVPAYGMAETTLMVSIGRVHHLPVECEYKARDLAESVVTPRNGRVEPIRRLIGCGPPGPEIDLRIVDPETRGEIDGVGEIWVRSPGVARGYWRAPEETAASFNAALTTGETGFLRTGDLGFVDQGEVFIVGRRKETLILAGRNYYPQDIELAIQARDPGFKTDGGAVAAVEVDNEERLVVFHEVQRPKRQDLDKLLSLVREVVLEETLQGPYAVVLLPVGEIPRTSSGKTRRAECWGEYQSGAMTVLRSWTTGEAAEASTEQAPHETPETPTERWLAECWGEVLDVPEVFRHDSFFELGGQSLQLVEMLQRVADKTGRTLTMKSLFEQPTLTRFAALVDSLPAERHVAQPAPRADKAFLATPRPLSEPQQRLWMLEQLGLRGGANVPLALRVSGKVDRDRLGRALNALVARHAMLRTVFAFDNERAVQRLVASATLEVETLARPTKVAADSDAIAWALDQEFVWRPFDLASPPLARAVLVEWSEGVQVIVLVLHHLVCDGGSFETLIDELAKLYDGKPLAAPGPDYWDYLAAGRAETSIEEDREYWRDRLQDLPPAINLPLASGDLATEPRDIRQQRSAVSPKVSEAIIKLAADEGVTPFMVYLSAYQLLLGGYSGDGRVAVGVAQSGREDAAWRRTLGCFINAVPLAADVSRNESFAGLLARQREQITADFEHSRLAWDDIVTASGAQRVPGRMPLAQAFFLYENAPTAEVLLGDLSIDQTATDYRGLGVYDLTLVVDAGAHGASVQLVHDPSRFAAALVEQMAQAYVSLLESITRAPRAPLAEVPLVTPDQRRRLLEFAVGPVVAEAAPHPLRAFESQAAANPSAVAVECDAASLTYAELERRAVHLAGRLIDHGVGRDDRVGLMTLRSPDMLAAMVALWKVGAAYVPLDPSYPIARLQAMTDDCRPAAMLADDDLMEFAPKQSGIRLGLQTLLGQSDSMAVKLPPDSMAVKLPQASGDRLAYVIYTSGSTGKPKGVMVSHGGVANFLRSFAKDLAVTSDDRLLAATTVSFDISVLELFLPLTTGATVVLADSDTVGDGGRLGRLIDRSGVTIVQGTPSTYRMLLATGWRPRVTHRLLAGGEELTPDVAHQLVSTAGKVWNVYGPTETTIWSTLDQVAAVEKRVSIGRPIDNTTCYLLDRQHRLAPEGVWGELAIGGAGLAEGYWNKPELNAERFPEIRCGNDPAERVYLTGDRARWMPDGRLEFGGRIDNQVKVRGHRIELGEIELALAAHPAIVEAAVVTVGDELGAALAAYFVSNMEAPSPGELRSHLAATLPDYMIPAAFVRIDGALPRGGSGKLDRSRLPKPEGCRLARSGERVAPRSPLEERLAEWWCEVLRLAEVGVNDNFFELGGHSLSVMQLTVRIRDHLGAELPLREAYQKPTIAQWADLVLADQVQSEAAVVGDDLLKQLEGMTDEEAVAFLEGLADE